MFSSAYGSLHVWQAQEPYLGLIRKCLSERMGGVGSGGRLTQERSVASDI